MSGRGVAPTYRWYEEAFEIEVTVKVPKETRAKEIRFKATSTSIDLRLIKQQGEQENEVEEVLLLDPARPLRGKVNVEGTFWSISDPDEKSDDSGIENNDSDNDGDDDKYREVTVTIEKQIRTPKDDFDIIEYDWKGLYNDDGDEVTHRQYDEPEELDVRQYAASLGVDIENIDMNLVDKSMFSSGLNKTASQKSPFESLKDSGLLKEVTRQADGTEWTTDEDGDRIPFSSLGKQNDVIAKNNVVNSPTRIETTADLEDAGTSKNHKLEDEEEQEEEEEERDGPQNPFASSETPWSKAVSVDDAQSFEAVESEEMQEQQTIQEATTSTTAKSQNGVMMDPIAELTVAKLREILKSRGLKVSGNKKGKNKKVIVSTKTAVSAALGFCSAWWAFVRGFLSFCLCYCDFHLIIPELQNRLRNEVQAMLADNSDDAPTKDDT